MTTLRITVNGRPAPQGSKRLVPAGGKTGGRMHTVESSTAVGPWREAVRAETQRTLGRDSPTPLQGPVAVRITFRLPRPKSHYGTGRNRNVVKAGAPLFPAGRPDWDKLSRAVCDGLTMGGAYGDDSQVVHAEVWKLYGVPGCDITVSEIGDDE